jgi:sugar lactone lactonase YvrE
MRGFAITMSIPLQMQNELRIKRIDPVAAIPGGEIGVELNAVASSRDVLRVLVDHSEAHVVASSKNRVLALVPYDEVGGPAEISVGSGEELGWSSPVRYLVGTKLAGHVHPVANPAFDPADGSLFVTRSGSRGEHVPVSLYQIHPDGRIEEFSGDITNPTSIAFDRRGQMFITSRFDGTVYRVSPVREFAVFASDLGIATGLAFNAAGEMFVGDRSGTIFRINEIGEVTPWAEHEPSVSAYHLAFGPDDALYVTGPTVSSFDAITRFDRLGTPEVFYRGLGRPQGLAFDREGSLYVAASLHGRRGVVRIAPDGTSAELLVAGMNVVGLSFSAGGEMIVATNDSIYSLPLGIEGTLLG